MRNEERRYFTGRLAAGVRKPTRVERKMKRKKKVKEAFTDSMLCATS
jgi:hypothetical protein